jgi:hypothetical protein
LSNTASGWILEPGFMGFPEKDWDEIRSALERPDGVPESLEDRVRLLEDKSQIRDLIQEYAYYGDARHREVLLASYDDEIERVLAGTLTEVVKGKENLKTRLERPEYPRVSGIPAPAPDELKRIKSSHFITSEVIRVDVDDAWAAARVLMIAYRADEDGIHRGVHESAYAFTFRRDNGRWIFVRQVVVSGQARNPLYETD